MTRAELKEAHFIEIKTRYDDKTPVKKFIQSQTDTEIRLIDLTGNRTLSTHKITEVRNRNILLSEIWSCTTADTAECMKHINAAAQKHRNRVQKAQLALDRAVKLEAAYENFREEIAQELNWPKTNS